MGDKLMAIFGIVLWLSSMGLLVFIFRSLLLANQPPEFGAGFVGGVIWGLCFALIWRARSAVLGEMRDAFRRPSANSG